MRHFTYFRLYTFLILCGLSIVLFFFFSFSHKQDKTQHVWDVAIPVRAARATIQDVPKFFSGLGTVQPSSNALVRSRVDGVLMRIHFTEGQHVQAGDLLAEIDPRPFEASLAEMRGILIKDQAQLDNARLDLQRYNKLSQNKYIAGQEYSTQLAKVREYEGIVEADKAKVRSAELQLSYSRITAPVGGRAGLRQVEIGNMVHSSDSEGIVRISEVQPCHVVFSLPENTLPHIVQSMRQQQSQSLPVQAWDKEGLNLLDTGTLISMDNAIDVATGSIKFKASFANANQMLFPNQFINARLQASILHNVVTVPSSAVQLGINGKYVFVVREKKAHMVNVTVPFSNDTLAVISQNIDDQDLVVIDGVDRLREGSSVDVVAEIETPRMHVAQEHQNTTSTSDIR